MSQLKFTIQLKSDAEPSSGFGSKLVDSHLPRNINGDIILPSSHLKGLIRENLENNIARFTSEQAIATLFGAEGVSDGALFQIEDAIAQDAKVMTVSRTTLNEFGTAKDSSLRTTESVATETVFNGIINIKENLEEDYKKLIKLGLLSLFAVGGNRNRGSGRCLVKIENFEKSPGDLLKSLQYVSWDSLSAINYEQTMDKSGSEKAVFLKLVFKATTPVCVPETPIISNNAIKTGFSIAASAVQGAILHCINELSSDMATECYQHKSFRTWPLNPSSDENSMSQRVSFTHKMSKLKDETGQYLFKDTSIESYQWDDIASKSPLKSTEGVLMSDENGVRLWKSSDMPRIITTHGVVNGDRQGGKKRNLYTIESLAPTLFSGIIALPEFAAKALQERLSKNTFVQFGKSRSVRGGGQLTVSNIEQPSELFKQNETQDTFIVQSPLLIPESLLGKPVNNIIKELVKEYGFGEATQAHGTVNTQFGWNRAVKNGMLAAAPVISPGAVFKLKQGLENLDTKLISGIGEGKERGFGAVLPHPGIAQSRYQIPIQPKVVSSTKNYARDGYLLWKKVESNRLSSSQISRVHELAKINKDKAIDYLNKQKQERTAAIWNRWKEVIAEIKQGIEDDAQYYQKVLKVCRDLRVADTEVNHNV